MHKNDRRAFLFGLASSLALPRRVASQAPGNPNPYLRYAREHGYDVYRAPDNWRVFFAGEACHPSMPATVAGAHLSGIDTAARVVEILG